MSRFDDLAVRYRCEYCLAGPDVWCRTRTGAVATTLHSVRTDPVRLSWLDGWHEGIDEGVHQEKRRVATLAPLPQQLAPQVPA